MKLTDPEKIIL